MEQLSAVTFNKISTYLTPCDIDSLSAVNKRMFTRIKKWVAPFRNDLHNCYKTLRALNSYIPEYNCRKYNDNKLSSYVCEFLPEEIHKKYVINEITVLKILSIIKFTSDLYVLFSFLEFLKPYLQTIDKVIEIEFDTDEETICGDIVHMFADIQDDQRNVACKIFKEHHIKVIINELELSEYFKYSEVLTYQLKDYRVLIGLSEDSE